MCACLLFHCDVRYCELVEMVSTLKLVRLGFYGGIFWGEKWGYALDIIQACHISKKRRKFALGVSWSILSNFDDSSYKKVVEFLEKCPTFLRSKD